MSPNGKKSDNKKSDLIAEYDLIVERANLLDIRMNGLDFNIVPDYYQFEKNNFDNVKFTFEGSFNHINFNRESGILFGEIEWTCKAKNKNRNLLKINATYLIVYIDIPSVSDDPAEGFLKKVGRFATYPYFRSTVSQLSWSSEANIPIMPVLKT